MNKDTFYVTTPIYYVTAKPHLGSLYSTLIADAVARWNKVQGKETFFATGTDEHGQKIAQAAHKAGKEPKAFVDALIPAYEDVWKRYELAYNYFIRTTDPDHVAGVHTFVNKLLETGDIYKGSYEGWYCTPCETFVTEESDTAPLCPSCDRPTIWMAEETYFFKLSAYQDKLLAFYKENPDFFAPKERGNEVISFVEGGLKDLSISRTTVEWGIPFPGDNKHTIYVWADALTNYLTAVGYGHSAREDEFKKWWPANVHVVGKDIVRFHAIYWPAFLMAAGLPLPKRLLVHGWIKVDKQKMSKSLGNVVDPVILADTYGVDAIRYYLLRHMSINQDGDFTIADLEQRINSDLVNDLGNLLQRMLKLAVRNELIQVKPPETWSRDALDLCNSAQTTVEFFEGHMANYEFHLALAKVWAFINKVNSYFHDQEPWKLAKSNPASFAEVISAVCHSLRVIGVLLWPVMPEKMEQLLQSIGAAFEPGNHTFEDLDLGIWQREFTLMDTGSLFNKIDPRKDESVDSEVKKPEKSEFIGIEDFAKVQMAVGTIEQCEPVEGSDKLLKSQVNLGEYGMRQVLSGIAKFYKPEDLVGKQGVFVLNLKPRKMMGFESQGMLLMAEDDQGGLKIIQPSGDVPNGTPLR